MHAETHKDEFPLAATAVQNHCYMDNLIPSLSTIEEARETRPQLSKLGGKAGFHIRKWLSNRVEVLEDIPAVDQASEVDLNKCIFPVTKTLGVSAMDSNGRFVLLPMLIASREFRVH
jgi:hypothetical protein